MGNGGFAAATQNALPGLINLGLSILRAVLVLLIGFQIAKSLRKMMNRSFSKSHMDMSVRNFLASMVYAAVCAVTVFVALEKLGVSTASIVALLGSAGLAIGLAMQDFLANFAGGVILLVLKPFKLGDYIVCGQAEGTVMDIGLFYTTLSTIDSKNVILPNGALANSNMTNVTAQEKRRLEIKVQISYESDIKKAKEILLDLITNHPCVLESEERTVFVSELEESGVLLCARSWTATADYWPTRWKLLEDLKLAYDREGIEIPVKRVDIKIAKNE